MNRANRQSTPSELRALDVLDHVPPGCKLELVTDGYNSPHLRPGEFAIADLTDRKLVSGELYLIRWPSNGGRALRQIHVRTDNDGKGGTFEGIWFSPLCKPTLKADGALDFDRPFFLSDGPLKPVYLPDYLMGRIIGLFQTPEIAGVDALPPPDLRSEIEEE